MHCETEDDVAMMCLRQVCTGTSTYEILVGGSNGDGEWRGMVKIVE